MEIAREETFGPVVPVQTIRHEDEAIEKVVERRRRFEVVEKVEQTVAATVRRLNPRKPRTV
jgi:hypothetical protein